LEIIRISCPFTYKFDYLLFSSSAFFFLPVSFMKQKQKHAIAVASLFTPARQRSLQRLFRFHFQPIHDILNMYMHFHQ